MSHIVNETVKDGDEIVDRNDTEGREATSGPLVHGTSPDGSAIPTEMTSHDGTFTYDQHAIVLLQEILTELKILNMYNAMCHDTKITDQDLGDN